MQFWSHTNKRIDWKHKNGTGILDDNILKKTLDTI